jgi:hypothetical protein
VIVGVVVGYVSVLAGIGVGFVGGVGAILWQRESRSARQLELLELLRRVPVYRQVLASYPDAVARVPPESDI